MKTHLDTRFAFVHDTLLHYAGEQDTKLVLPARFGGAPLCAIGDGAFMDAKRLQTVVIPEGCTRIGNLSFARCADLRCVYLPGSIRQIGRNAFSNDPQLSILVFNNLRLSRAQYVSLRSASLKAENDVYIAPSVPAELLPENPSQWSNFTFAARIPRDIPHLFTIPSHEQSKGKSFMTGAARGYAFTGRPMPDTELAALPALCGAKPPDTAKADAANDRLLCEGRPLVPQATALFMLDDKLTKPDGDGFLITASLQYYRFFWQRMLRIRAGGQVYHLYQRYYLHPDPNIEFVRQDVAILTQSGAVCNEKEARMIYAKYMLPALL